MRIHHLIKLIVYISISTCYLHSYRHVASANGSYRVSKWLIDNGALINARDRYDRTPLEVLHLGGSTSEIVFLK